MTAPVAPGPIRAVNSDPAIGSSRAVHSRRGPHPRGTRGRRRLPGRCRASRRSSPTQPRLPILRRRELLGVRRPADLRHAVGGRARAGHRRADRDRDRAVHLALRAATPRVGARLHHRPARRGAVGGLRTLGRQRAGLRDSAGLRVARREPRLDPAVRRPASGTGRTILTAAIVLAVMVLPIITAICREVFLQTPVLHEEAALALGATRWEMIRMAVLPFARAGIISAAMLGLGRALGETMAVAMVLSRVRGHQFRPDQFDEPLDDRREHRAELPRGLRASTSTS